MAQSPSAPQPIPYWPVSLSCTSCLRCVWVLGGLPAGVRVFPPSRSFFSFLIPPTHTHVHPQNPGSPGAQLGAEGALLSLSGTLQEVCVCVCACVSVCVSSGSVSACHAALLFPPSSEAQYGSTEDGFFVFLVFLREHFHFPTFHIWRVPSFFLGCDAIHPFFLR